MVRVLALSGSARRDSFNQRLVTVAAEGARAAGAEITVLDLADYPMPLFDQDSEAADGMPDTVKAVKKLFLEHDGLLISSPEYNSSISPLLKNTIDWVSRAASKEEPPLACYQNKVAGIMAASPGGLGGLRGLVHLRAILGNIGVLVIPDQRAISKAHEVLGAEVKLSERDADGIRTIGRRVAEVSAALER